MIELNISLKMKKKQKNKKLSKHQKDLVYRNLSGIHFINNYYFLFDQLIISKLILDLDLKLSKRLFQNSKIDGIIAFGDNFFKNNEEGKLERGIFIRYINILENLVKTVLEQDFPKVNYSLFEESYNNTLEEIKTHPRKARRLLDDVTYIFPDVFLNNVYVYRKKDNPIFNFYNILLDDIETRYLRQNKLETFTDLFKKIKMLYNGSVSRSLKENNISYHFLNKKRRLYTLSPLDYLVEWNILNVPFILNSEYNINSLMITPISHYWGNSSVPRRTVFINDNYSSIIYFLQHDYEYTKKIIGKKICIKKMLLSFKDKEASEITELFFSENKTEEDELYLKLKYNIDS